MFLKPRGKIGADYGYDWPFLRDCALPALENYFENGQGGRNVLVSNVTASASGSLVTGFSVASPQPRPNWPYSYLHVEPGLAHFSIAG